MITITENEPTDERQVLFRVGETETMTFLVDPGSQENIMSEKTFSRLWQNSPQAIFRLSFTPTQHFSAYGGHKLQTLCTFHSWIEAVEAEKPKEFANFAVIKDGDRDLLGYTTAKRMRVARVGLSVNFVDHNQENSNKLEVSAPQPSKITLSETRNSVHIFPKMPGVKLRFQLKSDVTPVKAARRNIPLSMQATVNERLRKMLKMGILEHASKASKWISPLHVVRKSNGDLRIVIDMRKPNTAIERQNHAMPLIDEMWERLVVATHFTKIDLKDAFHHIEIDEDSRELTTFMSDMGLLRFTRLAFGVSCAPEAFQKEMERVLAECRDFCIIFLDDILIYGNCEKELKTRQCAVEAILRQNNLTINEAKTLRNQNEVEFLGFHIKQGNITVTASKTQAINNFEIPKNMKDLRSFLGMVNYLQSFIPNLADKTDPLRKLLRRKNGPAIWDKEQHCAFENIKQEIAHHLSARKIFNTNHETFIYTDASPHALGAVLIQRTGRTIEGKPEEKMIACASKTLTEVERRYSQTQKEALGAVWGIERFYYYLMGRKFTLRTDASALRFIYKSSPRESKRVLNRADGWALRLEPYNFTVEYVKGDMNIADPFSRLYKAECHPKPFEDDHEPHVLCFVRPQADPLQQLELNLDNVRHETKQCGEIALVIEALHTHNWPEQVSDYQAFELELHVNDSLLWRDCMMVLPVKLQSEALINAHKSHANFDAMLYSITRDFWWPNIGPDIFNFLKLCKECQGHKNSTNDCHDEILLVESEDELSPSLSISTDKIFSAQKADPELEEIKELLENSAREQTFTNKNEWSKHIQAMYVSKEMLMHKEQFVVPKSIRATVLRTAHKGHPGRNTMTATLSRYLWWPTLGKDIEKYVRCCQSCTRTRKPEPPEPIVSTTLPEEPWSQIAIDFFSAPLDLKAKILVIKDYYSRYLVTRNVRTETANETIAALEDVFRVFGRPLQLKADNGPPFQSEAFATWCKNSDIKLIHSSPLSPRQNGLVERAMQGIKKALSIAKVEKKNFSTALNDYVTAYNSWPHAVTLIPPSDLMFSRAVRGAFPVSEQSAIIDATEDDIRDRDRISKLKSKLHQDRVMKAKIRTFCIGDEVYILSKGATKLCPRYGPNKFKVLAKDGSKLTLQGPDGNVLHRAVEHVTKVITHADLKNSNSQGNDPAAMPVKHQKNQRENDELILVKAPANLGRKNFF